MVININKVNACPFHLHFRNHCIYIFVYIFNIHYESFHILELFQFVQIKNGHYEATVQHVLCVSSSWISSCRFCQFLVAYPLGIKQNTFPPPHKYVLYIDMFGMCLICLIFFGEAVRLNVKNPRHRRRDCGVKYSFSNITFDPIWHRNCSLQNHRPGKEFITIPQLCSKVTYFFSPVFAPLQKPISCFTEPHIYIIHPNAIFICAVNPLQ